MKKWLILVFLAALWGYGLVNVCALEPFRGQVFLHYGAGQEVKAEEIEDAVKREMEGDGAVGGGKAEGGLPGDKRTGKRVSASPEITAWSHTKDVEVKNQELNRKVKADCMAVYGSREMASFRRLETGTYGYRTDREGCVISKGLAMELFGGVNVTGKYIWCRDASYVVRGVTDDAKSVILIPAKIEDGMSYMLLECGKDSSGKVEAQRFLYKYGISRGQTVVDGSFFFAAAGISMLLALWTVPVWIGYCCAVRKKREKIQGRRMLWLWGLAFVILGGVLLIWKLELRIPADLIPSRWSQFDFWTRKTEELRADMGQMGEAGRVYWLARIKGLFFMCVGCSAGSAVVGLVYSSIN